MGAALPAPSEVAPAAPLTMEQKIDLAAQQAAQIVDAFSPQAAALIDTGVAIEPIISGLIHMIAALFKHHTKK